MTEAIDATIDPYVQRMREARNAPAVLKARLVAFRAAKPDALVFAFEGDDDKIVYYHWIRRLRPGLRYEPFPCNGKREVRKLKEITSRDLGGLGERLFYFVDRDFDDLDGFENNNNVFMTEMYSVENYIVSNIVLEQTLTNEFPCHVMPDIRQRIISLFENDYNLFLNATQNLNFRVYVARRIPVDTLDRLPTKLAELINFSGLGKIEISDVLPENAVRFVAEPDAERIAELRVLFNELEPKSRYRGKFAYKFFYAWLLKLSDELKNRATGIFDGIDAAARARNNELTLGSFAAKSDLPQNLNQFLDQIAA